jgi:hypothetical protein
MVSGMRVLGQMVLGRTAMAMTGGSAAGWRMAVWWASSWAYSRYLVSGPITVFVTNGIHEGTYLFNVELPALMRNASVTVIE